MAEYSSALFLDQCNHGCDDGEQRYEKERLWGWVSLTESIGSTYQFKIRQL